MSYFSYTKKFPDGSCASIKKPRIMHLKVNTTYACDRQCPNCNRACTLAPSGHSCDMTPDYFHKVLEACAATGKRWKKITLTGGEPTMHPQIAALFDVAFDYRDRHDKDCIICINTYHHPVFYTRAQEVKDRHPSLEIMDTGKKAPAAHLYATYMAPRDTGEYGKDYVWGGCQAGSALCGVCLDHKGFYCCPCAAAIARVFGLDIAITDPKSLTLDILTDQYPHVCSLCGFYNHSYSGTMDEPISPSWLDALNRYRESRGLRLLPLKIEPGT